MKDITEEYHEPKPANTTIATLLKRMQNKDLIGYKTYGNSREYFPKVSKEVYFKEEIKNLHKRQLIAKIETIEQEQQKRKLLLESDNKIENYAKDKGISKKAMKELLTNNYEENIHRLKYYKEAIS